MTIRLLLLAAACSLAACDTLVVVSSNFLVEMDEGKDPDPQYLLKKQYVISLQCSVRPTNNSAVLTEPTMKWHRAGQNATLASRYSQTDSLSVDNKNFTSVLTLRRAVNEDIGNYTCTAAAKGFAEVVGLVQMQSRPLISFQVNHDGVKVSDVALWPGDGALLKCLAEGNPTGSVEWLKGTVSLTNDSTLNLTDVSFDNDRGYFTCISTNIYGRNSAKIYLRVKNPRAYQVPLFIFIAEVVVIAVIVGVYEFFMHRKRSRMNQESGAAYKTD